MSSLFNNNVGYTIQGTGLSIVNGIVSGFSSSNVLSIGTAFPTGYSNFEQVVTFTTPNDLSQSFLIERLLMPGSRGGIDLVYSNSNLLLHAYFRTTEAPGTDKAISVYTPALSANTTYTGKFLWTGTTYTLELWQNGSKIGSNKLDNSNPLYIFSDTPFFSIGGTQGSADRYFHGSIDLNNTYIKVNGITWFSGKQQASTTVNDVHLNRNVGYTIQGTGLSIVDGIVSGFSVDDYILLPSVPTKSISELIIKIKLNSSALGQNVYTNFLRGPSSFQGFTYCGTNYFSYTGFNIAGLGDLRINRTLQPDTDYWLKYTNDGTNCKAWWSENGVNYTVGDIKESSLITDNNSGTIRVGSRSDRLAFPGSIDLNNTYIKVNGITWFNGKQQASSTVNEVYYNKNCGYTVVGSPTINNGIVSGFSENDYLSLPSNPSYNASDAFEWNIKFTTPTEFTTSWLLNIATSSIDCGIYYAANKNIFIPIASGSAYGEITSTNLQENTTYIVNVVKQSDGNVVSTLKDANGQVIKQQTKNIGEVSLSYSTHKFGTSASLAFSGSIDLNNTYIKVNGITFFNGKDVNFSNQNNYIINNGNLVWANPNLWLQGDGASYIDTGIYGFNTTDYQICWKQTGSSNYYGVLGSRKSTSEDRLTIIIGAPGESDKYLYVSNYNSSYYQATFNNLTPYQKRILTKNSGTLTLNGVDRTILTDKEYQTPTTLKLYVIDTNGTLSSFFIGNIYYAKLYNNSTLVRHLVPVPKGLVIGNYTVPSNGMWDIVTQTFFANQGTGSFTFGKDGNTPVWTRGA